MEFKISRAENNSDTFPEKPVNEDLKIKIVKGKYIGKDIEEFYIEINTLDELIELSNKYGDLVIMNKQYGFFLEKEEKRNDTHHEIIIYDYFLE